MSSHNKHQSSASTTNKQADTSSNVKAGDQAEDSKVESKSQNAEPVQNAGKQQAGQKNQVQKIGQQFDQDQQAPQQGLGSINLSEILPDFNSEDIAGIGEKITAYADEKPLQTMGWAVAGGALVGWLLISKQGQSLLRTSASLAAPLVGNLLANRQGQNAEASEAPLKH